MTIVKNSERIDSIDDFVRVSKWGSGVSRCDFGRILQTDFDLYSKYRAKRLKIEEPTVGDVVTLTNRRSYIISHNYDETCQLSEYGSLCLHTSGKCGFSGFLNSSIDKSFFNPSPVNKWVEVWFFSENTMGAHRGCYTILPVSHWESSQPLKTLPNEYKC